MTPKYYIVIILSILLMNCSQVVDSGNSAGTNVCEPNPCLNGSECGVTSEAYACICTSEWDGDHCEDSNSLLVGKWKFYSRTLFSNSTCSGDPSGIYYTDSPEFLSAFPGLPLRDYELTITYNSDLTFEQMQTLIPSDEDMAFIYYPNYGSITDTGTEKCITWDEGSSGSCSNNCADYTLIDDTLRTYNKCDPPFALCEIWTSHKQQ